MSQRSSLLTSWRTSVVVCKSSRERSEAFETSRLRYVGVDDKQATVSALPPIAVPSSPPTPQLHPPQTPSSASTLEQRLAPTSLRLLLLSLRLPSFHPIVCPPCVSSISQPTPHHHHHHPAPLHTKLLYLALRGRAARIKYLETRRGSSATARQPLR